MRSHSGSSGDGACWRIDATLPRAPGTYALGLYLDLPTHIAVGALGAWTFPAGLYVYTGSAWGPGGLRARLGRHLRGSDTRRWHIDYMRYHARPCAVWLAPDAHLECAWARYLVEYPGAHVIAPRFGASDCRCAAHLFLLEALDPAALLLPGGPTFVSRPATP